MLVTTKLVTTMVSTMIMVSTTRVGVYRYRGCRGVYGVYRIRGKESIVILRGTMIHAVAIY